MYPANRKGYQVVARPENRLKQHIVDKMGTRWDVQSHEDQFSVGIPDLSYGARGINGWIELKRVLSWPKRPDTIVKMEHFTANQVNWLRRRGKKAGHCYLLIQVAAEYFVFSFHEARRVRAGITRQEFSELCILHMVGTLDPDRLLGCVTDQRDGKRMGSDGA